VARKLTRNQLIPFFAELPPCVVAMEACSSAHRWGRALIELGHEVRLLPPAHVKPYVRRNKSDQVDAAAIYEAMSRPGQRFVPVRSIENQAALMRQRRPSNARLGPLKDSCLVARRILTCRHQLVASSSYLKTCNPPERPQDLLNHRLLTFSHWRPENSWTFVHVNGRAKETVTFEPHFSMNDYNGLAPALLAGAGIGDLPPVVRPGLVREGRLVAVMPDWRFRTYDLSLVQVGNRHITKPCRLFKDLATQMAPSLFPDLPA
jgi:LysR substrate binding domain